MLQHAWQGERARMGKMCLHGPWEIPPLFAIRVTFQNSAVSVIPAKEPTRVVLLSHHRQGSDSERCWGKIPLSKRSICFNLEGQKKNQISITVLKISKAAPLNWNSPLAFIQTELWFKEKRSYTLKKKSLRALRLQESGAVFGRLGSLKKPFLQFWQCRPSVLSLQSSHTPPLRRPVANHSPRLKWQLLEWPLHLHSMFRWTCAIKQTETFFFLSERAVTPLTVADIKRGAALLFITQERPKGYMWFIGLNSFSR